ncbi:hypothetical protein CEXT_476211 [Caerostris extrusa]|uniref:Uncharacterized protein n=1 Tax=Caerostris extrusa TaxID=172846 RepID=A0AAV4SKV3_CAEEX|nr:hypothetical protein CEXT_476211 [Caerostris extrusa]
MQQPCFLLEIKQVFQVNPIYWPQVSSVERKTRALKLKFAILVRDNCIMWSEKLPFLTFVFNSAKFDYLAKLQHF